MTENLQTHTKIASRGCIYYVSDHVLQYTCGGVAGFLLMNSYEQARLSDFVIDTVYYKMVKSRWPLEMLVEKVVNLGDSNEKSTTTG